MKTSFWAPYISDHTIQAICWTLIHSLWIGLAIALVAGLVITITKKSSATLRYNLLCGILVLFTLSVYITFCFEMRTPSIERGSSHLGQIVFAPGNHMVIVPATTTPHVSLFTRIVWLLNEYTNVIFLVWLLLFVLKSLKMAGGLLYIQRIRNYKVHEVSEEFKRKIETFASQIGISQTVRLMQSELVKVPVAVGWLKPMILLPMGVILQLPAEQLESILWHELAHIRRRDYLVNILQGLVETVFFFNPGLLWLSSLIRAEREACCDDIVLSKMNRKANYLEALLAFGSDNYPQTKLAMSIGSGNQLRDRLKRMISQENKRLSVVEKVVLVTGLIVLSAFTGLPKTTQNAVKHLVNAMIKKPGHADTVKSKITSTDSATKQTRTFYKTEVISGDTVRRKVNTLGHFRSVLFKESDADLANNDISAEDTTGKKYHFIVADNKLVAMEIDGEKVKDSDLPKYQYLVTEIDVAVLEKRHIRETDMAGFKANNPSAKFKIVNGFDKKRYTAPGFSSDSIYNADLQKMRDIIADMVVRKLMPDAGSVKWFALTNTELIVNGQKQADELQQKYKAKYGVREDYGLYYGPVPVIGKGTFIDLQARRFFDSTRFDRFNDRFAMEDSRRALKLQTMRQRLHDDSANYAGQRGRALNVIAELVKDKIVSNAASVKWFGLSNTEFIVNGKKQPDDVQQRYKIKYGVHENFGLYYGPVEMTGTGVFIDDDTPGTPMVRMKFMKPNAQDLKVMQQNPELFKTQQFKQKQLFSADQGMKMRQLNKIARFPNTHIPLQDIVANITDDLVNDNIVKDRDDLRSFNLTNSSLVVNGKTQSKEAHQKLKDKYLKEGQYPLDKKATENPNFGLHYNPKTGSMGLGIMDGEGN